MCEFISWIEKYTVHGTTAFFLTPDLIFNTPRGDILRKEIGSEKPEDFYGHAAIRKYFEYPDGEEEEECSDFSSPRNFPAVIADALKQGKFKGFPLPNGLLSKPLGDKYQADRKLLGDKYWADRKPLDDKYQADLKPLDDKYQADRKLLDDKYWDLFANSENRAEAWR